MTRKHLQSMRERERDADTCTYTGERYTHNIYTHTKTQTHTQGEIHTHRHARTEPTHQELPKWRGDTPSPHFPPSEVSALTLMSIIQPIRHLFFWGTQVCRRRHLISSRAHLAPPGAPPTVMFLEHSSEDFHSVWP